MGISQKEDCNLLLPGSVTWTSWAYLRTGILCRRERSKVASGRLQASGEQVLRVLESCLDVIMIKFPPGPQAVKELQQMWKWLKSAQKKYLSASGPSGTHPSLT